VSPASPLFNTVPERDYLALWDDGRLNARRLVEFLGLAKADVAQLSGVALSSVRFDRKTPEEVTNCLLDVAILCALVAQFFDGDVTKTAIWWRTPNPLLGELRPRDMIRHGRVDKLRQFIMEALIDQQGGSALSERAETEAPPLSRRITQHRPAIAQLCERYGVRRLAVFGSAARHDFDPTSSDIDFVVEFGPAPQGSPARQYFDFKAALERLLSRAVDLVELSAMPETRLKRIIESTQVPLYAEAA
jgi:predicted nucleotidyltransferase